MATGVHRKLQEVYGGIALSKTTCVGCFRRFNGVDFGIDNRSHEGMQETSKDDDLEALLDEDPCQIQEELSAFSVIYYQPSHFQVIARVGFDSKTRNFDSL